MKKPLCPSCAEIVAERNRKGGSARSAKKTAANRANAKLPRKKADARTIVANFWLQPTKSFPDGPPAREEYNSDEYFDKACAVYDEEWRGQYKCANANCSNRDCPQHFPSKPAWIEEASASARAMVNAMTDRQVEKLAKQAMARVSAPKPKQNARQSRLRPKVGQVWRLCDSAFEWTISSITMDNVISRYDIKSIGIGSSAYDKDQWLADRKSGVIRIVRGRK